jgi:cobalt-zinc-cadmium efflux system outer membrane protein
MRTFLVCAAVAAVYPAGARAQTVSVTESEVLAQLIAQSPRVQAARAPVAVAQADILAAGRWPNPRVTFNREAVSGVAEDMLMVAQPLPITGRRGLDVQAATARAEARSLRAEDQVRRLRADARLAFTDLWAAQVRERELSRTHSRLADLAGLLAKREAAGDAAGFERLRAEREVVDIEATRSLAATERGRAQARLTAFLAPAARPGALEAVRSPAPDPLLPTVDELVARSESIRGDLVALSKDLDAATLADRAAGRRAFPEPELVGGTKTSNAGGGDVGSIVSVHLTVPLFDRGRPERAEAQARARQARLEADAHRQEIRAQILGWRAVVLERRAIANRHRDALAQGAGEIERIAQVSYEAGERGILELLDAYRTASIARLRQGELDRAVREAEIELEFVSGWEIP